MALSAALLPVLLGLGLAAIAWLGARRERGGLAFSLALGAAPLALLLAPPTPPQPPPDPALPKRTGAGGHVGSASCRSCHPAEYASWHASYHRTMTQEARGEAILAPEGRFEIAVPGGVAVVNRSGDALSFEMPDPEALAAAPEGAILPNAGSKRALLTTGSHHYQAYWVAGRRDGELRAAPVVWHREARRFVPRHDVFLQPPAAKDHLVRWNSNCLVCHATGAEPGHDLASDSFRTEVRELGIACEACHGAGGPHADFYRDPIARAAAGDAPARFIVNPARLDKERSSAVCGQCHAYALPKDEDAFWEHGYTQGFQPGRDLEESRTLLTRELVLAEGSRAIEAPLASLFWPDGTVRVAGRELNALAASACHARGVGEHKLGCVDCHSMHGGAPDDQLRPEAERGDACSNCHDQGAAHTLHAAGSPGSACNDCHMPRVAYALFRAQRSHRIDSPVVDPSPGAKPPACNLCHVDRSLAWTAAELKDGWGVSSPGPLDASRAWALDTALRGDAALRVILADALLSDGARAAAGDDFQLPVLATLLDDPYAAVRYVAARALTEHGDLEAGAYDFLGPAPARAAVARELIDRFAARPHADRPALFLPGGALDRARLRAATDARDDRDVTLAE